MTRSRGILAAAQAPTGPYGLPRRIAENISIRPSGCWTWHKAHGKKTKYACVWWNGSQRSLHKVLYELLVGEVPEGLVLDHVECGDKTCCNPFHCQPQANYPNTNREMVEAGKRREGCDHGPSRCSDCRSLDARNRQRAKRGIPVDWPHYKHFNRRVYS